jgi:glutamyl-tRNA synthetase/nondiscriminating glutamyl-tRNA synthetase
VFDIDKLSWVNRHYLKIAEPGRVTQLTTPYLHSAGWVTEPNPEGVAFLASIVPVAASAVDRLEQVPGRLAFLFDYSATRACEDPGVRAEASASRSVIEGLAAELATLPPMLDRDAFRAAAARVRERSGQKGKALFHPIRLALTGEPEGLELDIAVPAIERGAQLRDAGIRPIASAAERATAFLAALDR